jgi:2-polyprenyl-3-methyl-5-hydroxy-6-metoxy-1,4-benzoquinol methylase
VNKDGHADRFHQIREYIHGRSVLDVGVAAGWGRPTWLHGLINAEARETVGIDIDRKRVAAIAAAGFDVRVADAQRFELGRTFDVVHAGEIIEHLDDPHDFLSCVRQHLGPDSRFVATTPNPFCITNTIYRLGGRPRVNREHTCWYCEDTIEHLFARNDLELVEIRYLRHRTPGAMRSLASRALRLALPDRLAWNTMLVVARAHSLT